MAGLSDKINFKQLQKDNEELYDQFEKIKTKFALIRILMWFIVLRESIVFIMEIFYMIDECDTIFFHIINFSSSGFLECTIDLLEFIGLCWLCRAQYYLFSS